MLEPPPPDPPLEVQYPEPPEGGVYQYWPEGQELELPSGVHPTTGESLPVQDCTEERVSEERGTYWCRELSKQ